MGCCKTKQVTPEEKQERQSRLNFMDTPAIDDPSHRTDRSASKQKQKSNRIHPDSSPMKATLPAEAAPPKKEEPLVIVVGSEVHSKNPSG